ncbi:MAG: hypothetical protein WDM81_08355 [Rhizomicrobium sp.]
MPWIEPESVAPAVVFLASDEAGMVSGASYDMTDGDDADSAARAGHARCVPDAHISDKHSPPQTLHARPRAA